MPSVGWTLLIGGSGAASQTKKAPSNHPQQRLGKFKRIHNQSLKIWHEIPASGPNAVSLEIIQNNLHRLATILEDDTRTPAPHVCLSYAASSFVYTSISRIALASDNEDVVREAIAIFTILVDNDEDNLLGTERFAETVMSFVDAALGYNTYVATSETQGEVLELMFGIASKIRLEPELLPVWFRRSSTSMPAGKGDKNVDDSEEKIDFPLCHQFVGHVYHEGKVGDFARYGLLYMFESAANSSALENWIVSSDLPTLLASGLGALYSQLSRKLQIAYPGRELPLVLALSESDKKEASADTESFYSEDLQARLRTFMHYMIFWQDILKQCYSSEIKQTLIDHFQVFFLQQILYPSLLESSDADGGSSVAVLTYLWNVLDSIEHPDIIDMILGYLLALSVPLDSDSGPPRSPVAEKRRMSLLSLTATDESEDTMTPAFFNLTDMILASCRSQNAETVTAAMRLISVVLAKYHSYTLSSLLRTTPNSQAQSFRTMGSLNQELDVLIVMARDIAGIEGMDESYETCLKDSLALIESHVCSQDLFTLDGPSSQAKQRDRRGSMLASKPRHTPKHNLEVDDPLLGILLGLLATFFTNSVEVNLGLTGVIAHLASCPLTRLEGWLVRDMSMHSQTQAMQLAQVIEADEASPSDTSEDQEKLEQERIDRFRVNRSVLSPTTGETPVVIRVLQALVEALKATKAAVPEFESLLAGRKRAFQGATEVENELREHGASITSPRLSTDESRDASGTRAIFPAPTTPKRLSLDLGSTSPRGRALTAIAGHKKSPAASPQSERSKRPKSFASPIFRPSEGSRESSPSKAARAMSPLKVAHNLNDAGEALPGIAPSTDEAWDRDEIIERKVQFPVIAPVGRGSDHGKAEGAATGKDGPETGEHAEQEAGQDEGQVREATLTHVLTNVVILQEFVMELAAIMQVRAGVLDGEIRFV